MHSFRVLTSECARQRLGHRDGVVAFGLPSLLSVSAHDLTMELMETLNTRRYPIVD